MRLIFALMLILVAAMPAGAVNPDEVLDDPVLEERARALSQELRCLVCQNQSIDDSDAGLARDLRIIVRERLVAGDTDTRVLEYLVSKYGDFVLLRPPVKPQTWALWFGPPVLLLLGIILIFGVFRRNSAASVTNTQPLTVEEVRRLEELAGNDG